MEFTKLLEKQNRSLQESKSASVMQERPEDSQEVLK